MSDYDNTNSGALFKNNRKEFLVYYPCKKNANSSAKLFFMKHVGFEENVYAATPGTPLC